MLPKIGITTFRLMNTMTGYYRSAVNETYGQAIEKSGGLPLLIPNITDDHLLDEFVASCDGFIFSGGIDISPCFFGEDPHPLNGETSMILDQCQLPLMKKVIAARKPILAICRGHQVLNVACGGSLHQDVSLHGEVIKHSQSADYTDVSHLVTITEKGHLADLFGDKVWTNSYHHQSVNAIGDGLKITAYASDGIVEGIELIDYPFGVGVQWHPEAMMLGSDDMKPLFDAFIKASCALVK